MLIRKLHKNEYVDAMKLKVECWTEELNGSAPNNLTVEYCVNDLISWLDNEEINNDIRIIIGAFENNQLLGVGIASFAESTDDETGVAIELNGLWINKDYRKKGISIKLLNELIHIFEQYNRHEMIVYNVKCSESNTYYHHLGFKLFKQEIQRVNDINIPIDIFKCSFKKIKLIKE